MRLGDVLVVRADGVAGPLRRPWASVADAGPLLPPPFDEEIEAGLRAAHGLGVRYVRVSGILGDAYGTYREDADRASHDYRRISELYDALLDLGLRPVVELSAMPAHLARDRRRVTLDESIISPPREWGRWVALVRGLVSHLIGRYGITEVTRWPFQVWHARGLAAWAGRREELLRLYDLTARTVKAVTPDLRVGAPGYEPPPAGPAPAGAGWVDELLAHARTAGAPLDFVAGFGPPGPRRPTVDTWYGERPGDDGVAGAVALLDAARAAATVKAAVAYRIPVDRRSPRAWTLALAARLGSAERSVEAAEGLGTWAARRDDGTVGLLLWRPPATMPAVAAVRVTGLPAGGYRVRTWQVDDGPILAEPEYETPVTDGTALLHRRLPGPSVVHVELTPVPTGLAQPT